MVAVSVMRQSNALIATSLPPHPVAIFVGGTKGIGAHALRGFAKHAADLSPKIYVVARQSAAGDAVIEECRSLCPKGTFDYIKADASLMREVDRVCKDIAAKEKSVNLLVMSQGTLDIRAQTSEGLSLLSALSYYSRIRFARNLLPLLRKGEGLRRVVSVFTGAKEGPLDVEDLDLKNANITSVLRFRGHGASMMTLGMECVAAEAPGVGFVHSFPGFVQTNLGDTMPGIPGMLMRFSSRLFGSSKSIPGEEVAERHAFLATSARFAGSNGDGVKTETLEVAHGTDGGQGSGMYSVDEHGEPGSTQQLQLLAEMRKEGKREKVWAHTMKQFDRISQN